MKDFYWLNRDSRLFLKRGYLKEGQVAEERINEIAKEAERRLKIKGFADKFIGYMKRGFYSLSTPVWVNYGNKRGLPVSCVTGNTWINTLKEGGEQAKNIKIGDKVLTHKGNYKKVTNIIVTPNKGDIFKLKVNNRMTPIYLTGDHLVLTNVGWKRADELDPTQHLVAINGDINLKISKYEIDLKRFCSDYLPFIKNKRIHKKIIKQKPSHLKLRKNQETVDNLSNPFEKIKVDEKFAWFLGIWFAEGSVQTREGKPTGIRITINNKDEAWVANKWLEIGKEKLGLKGSTYISKTIRRGKEHSWLNVNIHSNIVGNLFDSFGRGCKKKTIPQWLIESDQAILSSFLEGVLIGDGTPRKRGNRITLANPKLILQLYQIGLSLKEPMSLQMQERAGKLSTTSYVYTLHLRDYKTSKACHQGNSAIKFHDGLYYATIKQIKKTDKKETVYDFTVEDDHSFSAAGVLLHNCFGSFIPDSMGGILTKHSEVGMMSKYGGGTSGYFGDLRERGAKISVGGESDGPTKFMEMFDKATEIISQGSSRRGSFAAYLPVEHPDILEFLQIREDGHPIQQMNIGITLTDKWMKEMVEGDKKKREVWARIIRKRYETGFPYLFFVGNANKGKPQVYKDKRLKIVASNLCVAGDQRVVSDRGIKTAKELYLEGGELTLFDNNKTVKSSPIALTEKNANIYKVELENGMSHKVTEHHKLLTRKNLQNETETKECKDLNIGDFIAIQTKKGVFGNRDMRAEAFLLGLYQSDGTQHKESIMIDIWENDFDLIPDIEAKFEKFCIQYKTQKANNRTYPIPRFFDCIVNQSKVKKKRLISKAFRKALDFNKGYIPDWIWESNEETVWQYIKGLYYADGTVFKSSSKGEPIQLSYADINIEFLKELQILITNLGMQSSIRLLREGGNTRLPDGKGGHKLYVTKDCYRLIIGDKNDCLEFEKKTGFLSRKGIKIENRDYRDNTKKFYKVRSISYEGKEDVYCCRVDSKEHIWVCNGILTHNCNEISLPSNEKNSFVCVLSSLNLLHWEEIKETDAVETLTYFLDSIVSEFVEKTEDLPYMKAANNFAKTHRALGLGVLGWHSLLQSKMISFESMEAKLLNAEIFQMIQEKTELATQELAKIFGEPELLKGYGRRNTTTMAVAPTTSSSFILGQVSPSIEPLNSNYFVKKLAKGNFTFKNPFLRKVLTKYSKNDQETWKSILIRGGSVQHLEFLTPEEREVFKTFGEISQKEIVIQAAQRQKYIDQGQSLNIMIPPKTPAKQVSDLLIEGWRLGIKGFYYQRSSNPSQQLSRDIMACSSCES